jgi:hypothetical protein
MKNAVIFSLLLFGCGGTLTDEQRKKVKLDMKEHAIKKVTEAQITEAGFKMGREISSKIVNIDNLTLMDSLQKAFKVKIVSLKGDQNLLKGVEKDLIEAYISGAASKQIELSDNIQRLGKDSVLYTKPINKNLPDGSVQFNYAIGIKIPRKELILFLKD